MRVLLFGKDSNKILPLVTAAGFEVVKENPEMVFSYGGDGTLMKAEYEFPGIPKVILKGSEVCKRCFSISNEEVLRRVASGKYTIEEYWKLEARAKGITQCAMNDIIVHNKDSRHAIRYRVWINDQLVNNEIIGDGVVVATPYGSTAYYRSITDSFFEVGIGLAFNNSTEQSDHLVLQDDSVIKIKIVRGPAIIYADNQEAATDVLADDEVVIKKSSDKFSLVKV